ncbi:MAG TPA: ABC transporter substrate-binding protein [Verrucomicrobiae bacterium]|jgi:putative tryptophan/tyrosine transport system substrate-binding protein|nr:ABC transporter substrate-binding protein [Verrucomicrobiae bacterium]
MKRFWIFAIVLFWISSSGAADAPPIPHIGVVSSSGDPRSPGPFIDAFRQKLRDLGYAEGKNVALDLRFAEGKLDRVPSLVEELARQNVSALVVSSMPAIRAAKRATSAVPVIMLITVDPVATGIIASLSRPGGNITGITSLNRDLRREAIDLLREAAPSAARIGVLWNTEGRASASALKDYEALASTRKVQFQSLEVRGAAPDLEGAFQAAAKGRAEALIVVGNPALSRHLKKIADMALERRLPSISERGGYTAVGGLMDYSADYVENFRRLAVYVDKVLKGAKPGDLAIEKSTFHLAMNLKTAQQLGLSIPQAMQKRADKVIR